MEDAAWYSLLVPKGSLINDVVRASAIYLGLLVLLRLMPNHRPGGLAPSDVLLITLTSGTVEHYIVGEGRSLFEATAGVGTIFFWSFALDWLAFHCPRLRWLVRSKPNPVIRDGRILPAGLRQELLTRDDLMTQLRIQGIEDVAAVQRAYVEPNGTLSIIPRNGKA